MEHCSRRWAVATVLAAHFQYASVSTSAGRSQPKRFGRVKSKERDVLFLGFYWHFACTSMAYVHT